MRWHGTIFGYVQTADLAAPLLKLLGAQMILICSIERSSANVQNLRTVRARQLDNLIHNRNQLQSLHPAGRNNLRKDVITIHVFTVSFDSIQRLLDDIIGDNKIGIDVILE